MAIVRTGLFMNWSGVTFTPTGGTAINILRVTSVKYNNDSEQERFKGDIARFNQAIAVVNNSRMVDVTTGDVGAAAVLVTGTKGSLAAQFLDLENGIISTGGGLSLTLSPCKLIKNPFEGDHAKYGTTTLSFEGYAIDGVTDPLVIVVL